MASAQSLTTPFLQQLDNLVSSLNSLIESIYADVENLGLIAQNLSSVMQGQGEQTLVKTLDEYRRATHQALNRLEQAREATHLYRSQTEELAISMDDLLAHTFHSPDFMELVFEHIAAIDNIIDFSKGQSIVQTAVENAYTEFQRSFWQGVSDFISDQNSDFAQRALFIVSQFSHWSESLSDLTHRWRATMASLDALEPNIPRLSGVTPAPALINLFIGELSAISRINAPQPNEIFLSQQQYDAIIQTFPDPRTQELMFQLMNTPTGRQFIPYFLYVGQHLGPDFITWQHLESGTISKTTEGGYISLNLDFPFVTKEDFARLGGGLIHEGVESYFTSADGIRQMGSVHADYVAEWFQGKYMSETGSPQQYAYPLSYEQWFNIRGKQYALTEGVNVNPQNIDRPGLYAQGATSVNLTSIPNPMGLDPAMLTSPDLNEYFTPFTSRKPITW